jgi:hypothetical protein
MDGIEFSTEEIAQIQQAYERKMKLTALQAEIAAHAPMTVPPALKSALPDFPPDPDFFLATKIFGRYVVEGARHLPDSTNFIPAIIWFATSPQAADLRRRLITALTKHVEDKTLFSDVVQALLKHMAVVPGTEYGSFILALESGAHAREGISASTGVAVPLKGGGPVYWITGMERSRGLILEAGSNLLIGLRTETPAELTGQFYGYHSSVEVEISIGSNLYFDTSKELKYQGFTTAIGVGIGAGLGVLWGWEKAIPFPT